MKIKTKLIIGYTVLSCLVIAVTISSIYGFKNLQSAYETITNQSDVTVIHLREIQYYFTGQANDERGFLLTGSQEFRKEIGEKSDNIKKRVVLLQGLITTKEQQELLSKIDAAHTRFTQSNYSVMDLYSAGHVEEAKQMSFGDGRKTRKELETAFNQLVAFTLEKAADQKQQAQELAKNIIIGILIASAIAISIGILLGLYMARTITKPIIQMTEHMVSGDLNFAANVTSADEVGHLIRAFDKMITTLRSMVIGVQSNAEQVAASAEELTASAEESAHAVNQVATSIMEVAQGSDEQVMIVNENIAGIEQLAASIGQVAVKTNQVSLNAQQAAISAKSGSEAIEAAIKQMLQVEQSTGKSAEVIAKLGGHSQEIGQIVDAIASIAGQTNLLALNAAIEAARAGEHGRGFAVVAEEVRKLAEQSQHATKEIGHLIHEIQGDTNEAVQAMRIGAQEVQKGNTVVNLAGQSFNEIAGSVDQVSSQMQDISAFTQQIVDKSQQIVASIGNIAAISKDNASRTQTASAATEEQSASIEEIASSSQVLAKLAEELQRSISHFKS
ncbi:methyl-accepting chemotaxis protein [Pelosinus fermentans]|uniref:Methyl-accepting chemotaxis sensory transducer n=1 Tax=Pelosinus fermentans JBW45 TaxID=1192197 RepID=I9NNB6_9FIRM|nr:HAMP domain-containing methyl-accepting chemotaxis protein [Pelosinus fermentans]AJQ25822.1 methyl-accepting chemotaxis sensory transducer [Pelosinus fermentans JBW45]